MDETKIPAGEEGVVETPEQKAAREALEGNTETPVEGAEDAPAV